MGRSSAQINLSPASNATFTPHRYAIETLSSADADSATHDGVKYYKVTHGTGDGMDFQFNGGPLISTSDTGLLYITLTGMAFAQDAAVDGFTVADGGKAGDTTALFRFTGGSNLAANATVQINVGDANQMLVTSDHKGGITVELINVTIENILGTGKSRVEHTREGAVLGVAGISTKITGSDPTAMVESGFMGFSADGSVKTASLGSVHIDLNADADAATTGSDVTRGDIYSNDGTTGTKLTLKGDLSFLEDAATAVRAVSAAGTVACPTGGDNLPVDSDDDMSASVYVQDIFNTAKNICITVADDTVIPAGSYTIDVDYVPAVASNRVAPIADVVDATFGSIMRDGTTINIPYVSLHEKYNHRFMIVNNGAATTYEFTFMSEDGITPTAGSAASGDLPKGTTHLKAGDIVSLSGGTRTAATFTAVARKSQIEMSSVLVTKETGATDLTILMPE